MSEELQGLLKRIQEEGISKADRERAEIIAAAEAEAGEIVAAARNAAADVTRQAREDADNTVARGKVALSQAARDILLQLRNEMVARMTKIVKDNIAEVMTPEFMRKIITDMTAQYLRVEPGADLKFEVMVSPEDLSRMQELLANSVGASFMTQHRVVGSRNVESGLQVSVKDGNVFFDFSDEALTDVICSYAGPRFAEYFNS